MVQFGAAFLRLHVNIRGHFAAPLKGRNAPHSRHLTPCTKRRPGASSRRFGATFAFAKYMSWTWGLRASRNGCVPDRTLLPFMMDFQNLDAQTLAQAIVNTIPEPFIVLDHQFRVLSASVSFYQTFK